MKLKSKIAIVTLIIVLGIILYFFTGGSNVVYKEAYINDSNNNISSEIIWPKTEEDKLIAGQAGGVAVSKDGNILYLHRGSGDFNNKTPIPENTLLVFDGKTHELVDSWGKNTFIAPHGLAVDNENNVWITDTELNKVFKFTMDGQLLNEYGENYPFYLETALRIRNKLPNLPTFINEKTFAKPTDVVIFDDGSFCVSDGYRNRRIVMFDKDGNVMWERNKLGSNDSEFNLPHGIAKDDDDNIYVADRSNGRIQIFSKEGNFIEEWNNPELSKPFGIEVKGDFVYVTDGGEYLYGNKENPTSQIIVFNKQGQIINRFGKWGTAENEFKIPHDIAVDDNGTMYIADLENNQLKMIHALELQ